jgi:hypothetical protein
LNIRHKYHLYIDRAFSLQVSQRPASTLKEKCLGRYSYFRKFSFAYKSLMSS